MSNDANPGEWSRLAQRVTEVVEDWLAFAQTQPADPAAARLAGVLQDPNGLAFTVGFVDGVMRPEDLLVAGENLSAVAPLAPAFLPWWMRAAIRVGGVLGPVLPWIVIPIARRVLRGMVGHLVLDATDAKLGPAIATLRESGNSLNLNLLGEAVLGEGEAQRRLDGTMAFLARDDVDYVSIKVSSVVSQLSMWDFDGAVDRVVTALTPLYRIAATAPTAKFINLDMEEYKDLDLTLAVFKRILEQDEFRQLTAGIVLQAYLPDAVAAMQDLTEWAIARRAAGGAPIKVRVVKGANLAMERVDAAIHDWPEATVEGKQAADTNYKRVLHWSMAPERTDAVRLGVAGHNLFDIAYAHLLANERGVTDHVEFEMLLGMAPAQAAAVKRSVGPLRLYTPVVHPDEFDVAIAYLIRRLEENAAQDNFMSAVFELSSNRALFERERDRFLASLADLEGHLEAPLPNRRQNRIAERAELEAQLAAGPTANATGFHNEADTDPAIAANREWGRGILARAADSRLGIDVAERISEAEQLDRTVEGVAAAAAAWSAQSAAERSALIHHAGIALAARRAELLEVMASEAGKTLPEGDAEVSEAIDFAHYYAEQARALDTLPGARFTPSRVTVVTPPWNFPVAIPAGGVLAALAAGSGVIIKPARRTARSAAVMVQALWDAGIPRELLALVALDGADLGRQLIAHDSVDRVILTGGYETAELFRSFRPDLPLLAETSGKNAIIVTPSADLDLAAADVVRSAFGHAGQKCSAASLVILVGSVARSERFRRQLVDAARSLRVGPATEPRSQMGPLVEPPSGKLAKALTTLESGERWLVEPQQLSESLWTPGIREGVAPGSEFHLTEYFGPILGIMVAATLDEAIELQNAVAFGLTAGLHSLDAREISRWLERVEAGNLYVNRVITGAIVQRQPFGGWKRSAVGAGSKAGGPNYLFGLGEWSRVDMPVSDELHLRDLDVRVRDIIEAAQAELSLEAFARVRESAYGDAQAWHAEFSRAIDRSGLGVERNVLRYRTLSVAVRLAEDASLEDAVRILSVAAQSRAAFSVSSGIALPAPLRTLLRALHVPVDTATDAQWLAHLGEHGPAGLAFASGSRSLMPSRIRLVSSGAVTVSAVLKALGGTPDVAVWAHEVTLSGRVEFLPFLREQAVSLTAHRFGNPFPAVSELDLATRYSL
ncbi:MAG TPA: proline dehydrogenase family protein [Microbacteriaceae bacterium]|nr:proline dehydrogenase family protein [Microbacteriaceae bacterium]